MKKASVALVLTSSLLLLGLFMMAGCTPDDTEPPQIQSIEVKETDGLHSEIDGDIIKGEVDVVVTVTDNFGVDSVVFFVNDTAWVDGAPITIPDSAITDQYTFHWNTMKLKDSTTYSIGVKAYDPAGNMAISEILTYLVRIPNNPPDPAVLTKPSDGDTLLNAVVSFRWEGSDPDTLPPQSVVYDVYFGEDADNLELVAEELPQVPGATPDGDTFNTWATGQIQDFYLAPETDYYWMIMTRDPYDQETPSQTRMFRRGENRPPPKGQVVPPEDSILIRDYPTGGELTLSWNLRDSDGDPVFYTLYFGEDPGTDPVVLADLPVIADSLRESLYKFQVSANTTYYWRPLATDIWGAHQDPEEVEAWIIVIE